MDQNVRLLLKNYQLSDEIVEQFAEQRVSFSQLGSLCGEDLELLGVQNESIRNQMLRDFQAFENQVLNFGE